LPSAELGVVHLFWFCYRIRNCIISDNRELIKV
jgi:hypothetical protein